MKVVLIHLTGSGGGIELYTSQLTKALSKQNVDVTLLVGNYVFKEDYYKDSDVKIIQLDSQKCFLKMFLKLISPFTYYNLLSIIDHEHPDVVHLVVEDLISGVLFYLLKSRGQKLILTEHDPIPHSGEKMIVKINLLASKFLLRRIASMIIVHGNALKDILIKKGVPENKIQVIALGDFSYYTKWSKVTRESRNTLLFFGRIEEYKGLEYLISAVPFIVPIIPDIKIIIAGQGNLDKYHKMINDMKYFEIYNRYILDEEVANFFQSSNVVVLPYNDGTQSGIVPIAYAFKRPVIVTNVGSIGEVVDDGITGFLIPPKNPEALANAVIKILQEDMLWEKMGKNGYAKITKELSSDQVASNLINLYQQTSVKLATLTLK